MCVLAQISLGELSLAISSIFLDCAAEEMERAKVTACLVQAPAAPAPERCTAEGDSDRPVRAPAASECVPSAVETGPAAASGPVHC